MYSIYQAWADAFRSSPDLTGVVHVYEEMKRKGIEFPTSDLETLSPIHTPQLVGVDSRYVVVCLSQRLWWLPLKYNRPYHLLNFIALPSLFISALSLIMLITAAKCSRDGPAEIQCPSPAQATASPSPSPCLCSSLLCPCDSHLPTDAQSAHQPFPRTGTTEPPRFILLHWMDQPQIA